METIFKKAMENTQVIGNRQEPASDSFGEAKILVVGCGGAGNNTANRLAHIGVRGAELVALNTDKQHLAGVKADKKILIGYELTKGLGAGGDYHPGLFLPVVLFDDFRDDARANSTHNQQDL